MEKVEFKELTPLINKREDVGLNYGPKEDTVIKKLESLLFREGLVRKVTLENSQFPGPHSVYRESILYTTGDTSEGIIFSLESIKGFKIRNDYSLFLIGNNDFKEKMKKVLQGNI